MPRMLFQDLTEIAAELELRAKAEDVWATKGRTARDKVRGETRAQVFREIAVMLQNAALDRVTPRG